MHRCAPTCLRTESKLTQWLQPRPWGTSISPPGLGEWLTLRFWSNFFYQPINSTVKIWEFLEESTWKIPFNFCVNSHFHFNPNFRMVFPPPSTHHPWRFPAESGWFCPLGKREDNSKLVPNELSSNINLVKMKVVLGVLRHAASKSSIRGYLCSLMRFGSLFVGTHDSFCRFLKRQVFGRN